MATAAPPSFKVEPQQCRGGGGGGWVVQATAMLFATLVSAQAAYRARRAPRDLAFVLVAYAALALLFWCIGMYERLPPTAAAQATDEPQDDGEDGGGGNLRRLRLKVAVWALSTALSVAFAWRVAAVMPPALAAVVWGMASAVALAGFYVLFVYRPAISFYSELDTCKCEEEAKPKLHKIDIV